MFGTNRVNIKELYKKQDAINVSNDGTTVTFENKVVSIGDGVIEETDSELKLKVTGNTKITGELQTSEIVITSDYRLKTNIEKIGEDYKIEKLEPMIYNKKGSKKKEIGFIAHELEKVYPDLVRGTKDGKEIQSINYNSIIGILVKEMKEMKERIKELEERIKE